MGRLVTAEAVVDALRDREAALRAELRAARVVREQPLAHGALPASLTRGRTSEFRDHDGGMDMTQVPLSPTRVARSLSQISNNT